MIQDDGAQCAMELCINAAPAAAAVAKSKRMGKIRK